MSVREVIVNGIKEIVQTALISLGVFFFVYLFVVQPHRIKGDSMMPNFANGELLLTEKVSYYLYKPSRGDVIVFAAPGTRRVDFIKRIIGLPRETIKIENGTIFINDQELKEPYEIQKTQGNLSVSLSENQYFVLGDNRGSSSDSRSFGPIDKKTIKGRAWLVYWPVFKFDKSGGLRLIPRVDYGIPDTFYDR